MTVASVVIPTTGDRGSLLEHSVASVLAQTVTDLEVLVVGDGVSDGAREAIARLQAGDDRVRFFDHPKHPSRGEVYRHEVLTTEATGDLVAYLCDRDLWLPDHVEELGRVLADADFGHTLRFTIDEDDRVRAPNTLDLRHPDDRARAWYSSNVLPLSMAGHTMAMYRALPEGWRTTPPRTPTDRYMWVQFLDQPSCRVASSARPTVLAFKRPRTWTVAQRLEVLERWSPRLRDPALRDELTRDVLEDVTTDGSGLLRRAVTAEEPALGRWVRSWLPAGAYDRARAPLRSVRHRLQRRRLRPGSAPAE
jgi:Glycosyl transferase family 2